MGAYFWSETRLLFRAPSQLARLHKIRFYDGGPGRSAVLLVAFQLHTHTHTHSLSLSLSLSFSPPYTHPSHIFTATYRMYEFRTP